MLLVDTLIELPFQNGMLAKMTLEPEQEERIRQALAKLNGLWEAHLGVVELMAIGSAAVPQLKVFVAAPAPSGIFQPRCEAVGVLGALGAKEVLLDLLAHPRTVTNPVEATGEEAVSNACARGLENWQDEEVFDHLLAAGHQRPLAGVVEALGKYARAEAIPVYDAALGEDFSRAVAEEAFRKLGPSTIPHLISLSQLRLPDKGGESESNKRRRRSALKLLAEFPTIGEHLESLLSLTEDADPEIALRACVICLPLVSDARKEGLIGRLLDIADHCRWPLAEEARRLATSVRAGS